MSERLNRREFLKGAAVAGLGLLGGCGKKPAPPPAAPVSEVSPPSVPPPTGKSQVVIVRHSGVQDEQRRLDRAVLEKMLDEGMLELSGESSVQRAWEKYFSSDERVGLKPNGIAGPALSTATALIEICIERLLGLGLKAENIIVWEQDDNRIRNCGLQVNLSGPGVRRRGINGDWDEVVQLGSFRGRLTKIVTQRVDAILNLPILKDHNIAGITLALKNHYGTHDNPAAHHPNNCDPYCADLNALPAIKDKTRLIIADATRAAYEGGPSFHPQHVWAYNGLMFATDPVALDYTGWQIIEKKRAEVGRPPLTRVGRPPKYIASAAARGLGTNDPKYIELIERDLA